MTNNAGQDNTTRSDAGGIGRFQLLRPLTERNFFLLWLGESVSVFGSQFQALALTWLILEELGSGFALGSVMMAGAIPTAVFMLFGGVLSDRMSPRLIMLLSNAFRFILVAILALIAFNQAIELWHLYILNIAFGTVGAFFAPAMMTLIPRLLSKEKLQAGNSLVMGTMNLSGIIGPAVAGIVVASVGVAMALGIDSATFAFAAVMLWLMKGTNPRTQPIEGEGETTAPSARSNSAFTDIKNGFRYAWSQPGIRAFLPALVVINLCFAGPIGIGLPKLIHSLTGEATSLGTVMAVVGGATLLGTLLAGIVKPRRRGILAIIITVILGISLALLGWAPSILSISLVVGVIGIGDGFINVVFIAWFQTVTREDMLGRVMSLVMFASAGMQPVSLVLAGILVDLNPTLMFAGAGGLVLLTSFYLAASKAIRTID